MRLFFVLISAFVLFCAHPAQAQDFIGQLNIINQTPAERNPNFKSANQVFDMHVVDGNRQLIGDVEDLVINEAGEVIFLVGLINWGSRREKYKIMKAYEEVVFHEHVSSFQISFSDADRIDTDAAILSGNDRVSIKSLLNTELRSVAGRSMGVIRAILFDDNATAVKALVLENVPRAGRYDRIAVPYDPAYINIGRSYGNRILLLERTEAGQLIEYARNR